MVMTCCRIGCCNQSSAASPVHSGGDDDRFPSPLPRHNSCVRMQMPFAASKKSAAAKSNSPPGPAPSGRTMT